MSEYICHYLADAVRSAEATYVADELPTAMAMHNAALPEFRDKVLKWVGPTGITFLMHDSKLTLNKPECYGTIWVCVCCMLTHANGECCAEDTHGGDSCEPLSAIEAPHTVAMGMAREEHSCRECEGHPGLGDLTEYCDGTCQPMPEECDCETNTFSTSQCEGCGSYLHGERHAMTLFAG